MKKITLYICALALIIMLLPPSTTHAHANGDNHAFLVYSQICPTDVLEYAKKEYGRFAISAIQDGSVHAEDSLSLGTPFTIENSLSNNQTYFFPIISKNEVIGTFRVCLDVLKSESTGKATYTGVFSPFLAASLNSLNTKSSEDRPVVFYVDNGNVLLSFDSNAPSPCAMQSNNTVASPSTAFVAVNPLEIVDTIQITKIRGISKYLTLSIIEEQGSESWCGAYATAIILRYLRGETMIPTALDLMQYYYGINPGAQNTFSVPMTLSTASRYGYSPIEAVRQLTGTETIREIDNNRPIYVNSRRYDSSAQKYNYHAIVIRGYNVTTNTYSIWNPWNRLYETMDLATGQFTTTGGLTYTWYSSIYDW